MAPGANIGESAAIFEAVHGSAPAPAQPYGSIGEGCFLTYDECMQGRDIDLRLGSGYAPPVFQGPLVRNGSHRLCSRISHSCLVLIDASAHLFLIVTSKTCSDYCSSQPGRCCAALLSFRSRGIIVNPPVHCVSRSLGTASTGFGRSIPFCWLEWSVAHARRTSPCDKMENIIKAGASCSLLNTLQERVVKQA